MVSLIGAHFSRNGIKQFPARVVLSMYGTGVGGDETTKDTIVVLRESRVFPSGEAPPDFHSFNPETSGVTWEQYGRYWYAERTERTVPINTSIGFKNFREAWSFNQGYDYYTICNEQGGGEYETPEEREAIIHNLRQLVNIERSIMQQANADGIKCCVLNLAGGSPGDFEIWKEICAPFIMEAWANGNIYGRHCYADKFVNDDGSVVPGQPQRVIDELNYLRSLGYTGGMVLTECGMYGGYNVADFAYFEDQIKKWEAVLSQHSDIFIGLCWWECGDTDFNADYTEHLRKMVPYMNANSLEKWESNPTQPPVQPSPEEIILSFESGWMDDPAQPDRRQIPNGFELSVIKSGEKLWYGDAVATGEVECMHRLNNQLPPNEQLGGESALVLEGDTCFKIQAVQMATGTQLSYSFAGDGRYLVTVPIQIHYQGSDKYDREPPLEINDVYVSLLINDTEVQRLQFPELLDREWLELTAEAIAPFTIRLIFQNTYANSRDLFTDRWQINKIEESNMKHKAIVVKLPQDMTAEEWNTATATAFPFRHTVTASHDDMMTILGGGNEESFVKFSHPERDESSVSLVENAGYTWERLYPEPEIEIINIVDDLPKHPTLKYATRPLSGVTHITIHHTVSPPDRSIESIAAYHVDSNGWPGIGYHFVIKADGRIFQTNYLTTKSYHAGSAAAPGDENAYSVGIALQGDFTNSPPPQAQLDAAKALAEFLRLEIPSAVNTLGHRQMPGASTQCPGNTFSSWLPYITGSVTQPPSPPPPPPSEPKVDMLAYLRGPNGFQYEMRRPDGSQERYHIQWDVANPQVWYIVKGENQGYYERWSFDDNYIYLEMDTSPSPASDGTQRYYTVKKNGVRSPNYRRFMSVGEVFNDGGHVVQFYNKTNCQPHPENSGNAANTTTFVQGPYKDTFYNNITSDDVIKVLENTEYQYWVRGIGRVRWESAWGDAQISEIHGIGQRPDVKREFIPCL